MVRTLLTFCAEKEAMTRTGIITTAWLASMGLMGHAACDPAQDPSAQSNNVTDQDEAVCRPPRVLFVVDASSSMLESISDADGNGPTQSKWEALAGAVQTLTTEHDGTALFGLMTFPGATGGCSAGDVLLEPAPGNEAAINQVIGELPIANDAATPAGQTLMKAAQDPTLLDDSYENIVVFISDGWQYCSMADASGGAPTCATADDCDAMGTEACGTCNACQVNDSSAACQGQNGDGCYCVRNWPVLGVQALADAGVKTYVVGFGDNVDARTLNQAAAVGGDALPGCEPDSDSPSCYLEANSPAALSAALDSVMLRLSSAPCAGDCGIRGNKTCTLDGWSACEAPAVSECTSQCGSVGSQSCVEGQLSKCSATCEGTGGASSDGGAGGSDASTSGAGGNTGGQGGSVGGAGGSDEAGGAGGSPATSSTGSGEWPNNNDDPWEDPDDDWEDGDWDDEQSAARTGSPSPEAEGSCAYAPAPRQQPTRALALMALALGALTRRRRSCRRASHLARAS